MLVDARKTFDALLVHEANRAAVRAVKRAVSHGSRRAGPLLIVGPPASGKTQLLHAVANAQLAHDPLCRVELVSADTFTADFVDDRRAGRLHAFRSRFAHDMTLLVDGLEDIERWTAAEDELERAVRAVVGRGGNVVLTMSDASEHHVARVTARVLRCERGEVLRWHGTPVDPRVALLPEHALHVRAL